MGGWADGPTGGWMDEWTGGRVGGVVFPTIIFILLAFFAAYLARKQSMSLITWLTHWRGADNWLTKAGDTLCPLTLPLALS